LNGFFSKWLIYQGVLGEKSLLGALLLVLAVFGSGLTLASFVKVLYSVFWGPRPGGLEVGPESSGTGWMKLPMLVLAAACILLGIWAYLPISALFLPALSQLGIPSADVRSGMGVGFIFSTGNWDPVLGALLVVLGAVIGVVYYLFTLRGRVRTCPSYVSGERIEPFERLHYPGTHFYLTVSRLVALETVYRDAEAGAFDPYYLSGKYGGRLVELLRSAHSGMLSTYVSWCVIGLIVVILILMAV